MKSEISSVREAHALKLKFHQQTEIRYNSIFSRLLGQDQAIESQSEARASIPSKIPHSQKWAKARKQGETSESSMIDIFICTKSFRSLII